MNNRNLEWPKTEIIYDVIANVIWADYEFLVKIHNLIFDENPVEYDKETNMYIENVED